MAIQSASLSLPWDTYTMERRVPQGHPLVPHGGGGAQTAKPAGLGSRGAVGGVAHSNNGYRGWKRAGTLSTSLAGYGAKAGRVALAPHKCATPKRPPTTTLWHTHKQGGGGLWGRGWDDDQEGEWGASKPHMHVP